MASRYGYAPYLPPPGPSGLGMGMPLEGGAYPHTWSVHRIWAYPVHTHTYLVAIEKEKREMTESELAWLVAAIAYAGEVAAIGAVRP